jgi:polysaccharide pyruvyl transferase WcaK-like protein
MTGEAAPDTGRRSPRIGFWGNFGTANWGNECTLQAVVQYVRKSVPEAELLCLCSRPADTATRHGLQAFPINRSRSAEHAGPMPARRRSLAERVVGRLTREVQEWSTALTVSKGLDVLMMTGTGMLTDSSEGPFGLPYDMFRWSLAARVRGGHVRFASVGVEPIDHPLTKLFIGAALRLADYRSYRDRESLDHLVRMGLAPSEDAVYPDLAFSLPERLVAAVPSATDKDRPHADGSPAGSPADSPAYPKRTVAVGLYDFKGRGLAGPTELAAYRNYLDKVCAFTRWLLEHDYDVRVVLGDLTYDEAVLDDFRVAMGPLADRIQTRPARSVDEVLEQLSGVEFVVASRFHTVLLSLLLGKLVVSISYNEKNDVLLRQMGLGEFCQAIADFEVSKVIAQFVDLQAREGQLRPAIAGKIASYREALKRQYDLLLA